jgi:hypothetical protein
MADIIITFHSWDPSSCAHPCSCAVSEPASAASPQCCPLSNGLLLLESFEFQF